jgi:hypothetical protein
VRWRYRYRREYLGDDDLVARCNELGDQGWALLGSPHWVPGDQDEHTAGVWRCFFRRVISNREQIREVFALHRPQEDGAR